MRHQSTPMIQRRPKVSLYIGAFVEYPGSSRPNDVRISPFFKTGEEFNQWLRNTHRVELDGITITFHAATTKPLPVGQTQATSTVRTRYAKLVRCP